MKIIVKEVSYEESLKTLVELDKDMISVCSKKALELYFKTEMLEGDRG